MEGSFLIAILLVPDILSVFAQEIPADRTNKLCTGSNLTLKFDGATYDPANLISWHFIPAGSNTEEDIGLISRATGKVLLTGKFAGRTLDRIGDQGMMLADVTKADSGLYRTSQGVNFKYNVTVQDPCLNVKDAAAKDEKKCVIINCLTAATFKRFEIDTDQRTVNPLTYCSTSLVTVTCVVEEQGQELSDNATVDLTVSKDNGGKNNEENSGGLGGGVIAAIVVGSLAGVGVIVGAVVLFKRRGNSRGFHNPIST